MPNVEKEAATLASLAGNRDQARVLRILSALGRHIATMISDGKACLIHPEKVSFAETESSAVRVADPLWFSGAESAKDPALDLVAGYVAPEVFAGKPETQASTVYHLAAVAYHVLTGELPFSGNSPAAVRIKVLLERPVAPRNLCPALSENLERLLLSALDKKIEARPDLHAFCEGLDTEAKKPPVSIDSNKNAEIATGAARLAASSPAAPGGTDEQQKPLTSGTAPEGGAKLSRTTSGRTRYALSALAAVFLVLGVSGLLLLQRPDSPMAPPPPAVEIKVDAQKTGAPAIRNIAKGYGGSAIPAAPIANSDDSVPPRDLRDRQAVVQLKDMPRSSVPDLPQERETTAPKAPRNKVKPSPSGSALRRPGPTKTLAVVATTSTTTKAVSTKVISRSEGSELPKGLVSPEPPSPADEPGKDRLGVPAPESTAVLSPPAIAAPAPRKRRGEEVPETAATTVAKAKAKAGMQKKTLAKAEGNAKTKEDMKKKRPEEDKDEGKGKGKGKGKAETEETEETKLAKLGQKEAPALDLKPGGSTSVPKTGSSTGGVPTHIDTIEHTPQNRTDLPPKESVLLPGGSLAQSISTNAPQPTTPNQKRRLAAVLLLVALLSAFAALALLWVMNRDQKLALQTAKTQNKGEQADSPAPPQENAKPKGAIDPFSVGQYTCFERLGEGGMGMVYKARHNNLEKEAAVKVLSPAAMVSPDAIELFEREAKLASQINHPNSVFIYDHGNVGQALFYLVMEYIDGQSLDEIISPKGKTPRPLPLQRVLTMTKQICSVLDTAHGQGIVHRDLKPHNVMVVKRADLGDFVKVVDFGIARSLNAAPGRNTAKGAVIGTPAYMSPEQAAGDPTVDTRSDIFSLAVMVFHMLSGKIPFSDKAKTPIEQLLQRATMRDPPGRGTLRAMGSVTKEVEAVLLRALDPDRNRRPQTAGEFYRELEQAAA